MKYNTNAFAVIRASDIIRAKIALYDLVRYANLTFADNARILDPYFADKILVDVMNSPLKIACGAACIVPLKEDGAAAIGRLMNIHPPAHVVIVSPRHKIFNELTHFIYKLPIIELNVEKGS